MSNEVKDWVAKEFETLDFNSERLNKRFKIALSDMSNQTDKSIWLASGSRTNAKAVYRMIANKKCTPQDILTAHINATTNRSKNKNTLLAVQDTMAVNYANHTKTEGLGYNCELTRGINVHTCLLLTPQGIPLGILTQNTITRSNPKNNQNTPHQKRLRPIEEKESYRWLQTMQTAKNNAPKQAKLIHIADREGDMYELYSLAAQIGEQFIIRSKFDRLDTEKNLVLQTLRNSIPIGKTVVNLPANRKIKTKERDVVLTVQYGVFDVARSRCYVTKETPSSLKLTLVRLFEEQPLDGVDAIEWVLMTNLEVKGVDDALLVGEYYKHRWKIERFHFVLKSGCMIEKIQQRSLAGIELVILMYSIISVHVMQLTFLARSAPDLSCGLVFGESEWKLLYRAANHTHVDPLVCPSMVEAVGLVARIGGFVGAKSDGPPGLKVIWVGLNKFYVLMAYRDAFSCF